MQIGKLFQSSGVLVVCLTFLSAAGCRSPGAGTGKKTHAGTGQEARTVMGTVQHIEVEGGFYGIVTNDGQKLDPVNLPKDFQQDGVRIEVRVVPLPGRVSIHQWGELVRILEIERLPPAGETPK
jgi:hypothetical protein